MTILSFFLFLFLLCDYRGMRGLLLRIHNKTVGSFYSVLKEKIKRCVLGLSFVLIGSCLWKEPYLINVSDHLNSWFEIIFSSISMCATNANKSRDITPDSCRLLAKIQIKFH